MDFTLEKYRILLLSLTRCNDLFLRHDVDVSTRNALTMARVESKMGIYTTYYFRTKHFTSPSHLSDIRTIITLGHRIGYHYEDLAIAKGNMEMAYKSFIQNLETLRKLAPVTTACSHGSPISSWNSQLLWGTSGHLSYDIHALGIEYEPMLDTDFSKTLYLTDTGRRWDGYKVSVRDKVPKYQGQWLREGLVFHSTDDIVKALNDISHPIKNKSLLINIHPERWTTWGTVWIKEVCLQWLKNSIKGLIVSCQQK